MLIPLAVLGSCGGGTGDEPTTAGGDAKLAEFVARLDDPTVSEEERLKRILAEGREGNTDAVRALIRLMKDRSQCAFLVADDAEGLFGFQTIEFQEIGPDVFPAKRVAAVVALERIGSPQALPDLMLVLDDRDLKVRAHAARALLKFGSRAGMPVLLALLEEKAYGNETANMILEQVSGESMGFHQDSGQAARAEAIERWKAWWAVRGKDPEPLPYEGRPYQIGIDGETDRRLHFYTDVIGQMQFLFHSQAKTAMSRLGVPSLAFLRSAVERASGEAGFTLRAGIAQVLATIDHPNALALLGQLQDDRHETVRQRTATALGALGSDEALERLARALGDTSPDVVLTAVRALGKAGTETAERILLEWPAEGRADYAVKRTLALFEASKGKRMRDEVLELLVSERIGERNDAHGALVALTGETFDYQPVGSPDSWAETRDRYRQWFAR